MFERHKQRALQKAIMDAVATEAATRPSDTAFQDKFMAGEVPEPTLWYLGFYRTALSTADRELLANGAHLATQAQFDVMTLAETICTQTRVFDERQPVTGETIAQLAPLFQCYLYAILFSQAHNVQEQNPITLDLCDRVSAKWLESGGVNPTAEWLPNRTWWLSTWSHTLHLHDKDGSLRVGFEPGIGRWDVGNHRQTLGAFGGFVAMAVAATVRQAAEQNPA